ncbi:hypothetical protein OCD79_13745 [Bacillus wiedmannii]|uniref:hypothetical protein n=1 Tax=Bacillus cereus group TaxID=86661 RepID=UPI000E58C614|nr:MULTISPECIES: hypothetical protein [Bacillus cereus group]MCU5111470.1 hypothetical protein [Bacillus wiedmannii]MCU5152284.1 hypothetical protein [Bacillus wiedmannii]RHW06627.1 hypothetical protein B7P27_22170 [Bacillus cereus]
MNKKEKGRPQKYTDEELTKILLDYASQNPGRINYLSLEKTTGIKRHVWSRRKRKDIERLNAPLLRENNDAPPLPLPNIEFIIERYGNDTKALSGALKHVNEVIQSLYDDLLQSRKKNEQYKENIQQQQKKIKDLTITLKEYEDIIAGSVYKDNREETQLQNNILTINNNNKENAVSLDFKKMFPNIFKR